MANQTKINCENELEKIIELSKRGEMVKWISPV